MEKHIFRHILGEGKKTGYLRCERCHTAFRTDKTDQIERHYQEHKMFDKLPDIPTVPCKIELSLFIEMIECVNIGTMTTF